MCYDISSNVQTEISQRCSSVENLFNCTKMEFLSFILCQAKIKLEKKKIRIRSDKSNRNKNFSIVIQLCKALLHKGLRLLINRCISFEETMT